MSMPDGRDFQDHAVTQAFIGLFLIMMIIIFCDLCIKFASNRPKLNKAKSQSATSAASGSHGSAKGSAPTGDRSPTSDDYGRPKRKPVDPFYKITSIICIASFILAVAIDFGDGVYYFASGIDVFHTDEYWLIALTNLFYGVSAITLYIFIFGRLYFTFKETEHALNTPTIAIVSGLIALNSIATVLYLTCYAIRYYHMSLGLFYELLNASNVFILIADLMINVFILGLFVYKLQHIFVDWGEYEDIANLRGTVAINEAQLKLASIVTKHVLLSGLAMLWNVLFYASVIAGSNVQPIYLVDLYFLGYSNLIKAITGFVVTFTLYLNMGLKNSLYFGMCDRCHDSLQTAFIKINKRRIKEEKVEKELALEVNSASEC